MALQHRLSSVIAVAALGLAIGVCAAAPTGAALLELLRSQLVSARSLVPGARPTPPTLELKSLVGLSRSKIQSALGAPTYCEPESPVDSCAHVASWRYEWGPAPPAPREQADGSVVAETGGPWLLVIDFASDIVSGARWQGQR